MKLEKVNDHQIRVTLTKADLADRELKLSELAYGTEKAKNLFRDMMQQAAYEFGFEAEDIPLMIEAIPLSSECIVLIITKVEDPEELDTRFSNFAPSIRDEEDSSLNEVLQTLAEDGDNVLDLFKKLHPGEDNKKQAVTISEGEAPKVAAEQNSEAELFRAYAFSDVDAVIRLSHILESFFFGKSSLYRNDVDGNVILAVSKGNHTREDFNRVCNIISEYGSPVKFTTASEAYFNEHDAILMKDDALMKLLFV